MNGTPLVVDNRSGKWSQSSADFRAGVLSSVADQAAAVMLTEVTEPHQAKRLTTVPGYTALHDLSHGDRDEVALLTNDKQLDVLSWSSTALGPDLGPGGRIVGGVATATLTVVRKPIVLAVWHAPSAVEGDWQGRRADAWRAALEELQDEVHQTRIRVGLRAPVFVGGDWNVDFRRQWVRDAVAREWPALEVPRLPLRGGSHGHRYIDPVLVTGAVRRARLSHLPRTRGNDHRPQRLRCRVYPKQVVA